MVLLYMFHQDRFINVYVDTVKILLKRYELRPIYTGNKHPEEVG